MIAKVFPRYAVQSLYCASLLLSVHPARAVETLDTLRVSEVFKSVQVLHPDTKKKVRPKVNDRFGAPEILSTGDASRAEMQAADGTVTRVGANTVFHFSPGRREVNLEKGTLLFHSPAGKGGGMIRSSGATAGVVGTSIIVSATKNGGFKLLVLEGKAKATLPNGTTLSVGAGQLTFVLPGSRQFGPVVNFRLKDQVAGSNLVKGFKSPLASLPKITEAVAVQEQKIATGRIEATSFLVNDTNLVEVVESSSSLARTRVTDTESEGGIAGALKQDLTVTNGAVDRTHLFSYRNADIPPQLLKLLGSTFASQSAVLDPDYVHAYLVGNNVSILGDKKVDLFASAPSTADGFILAAQNNVLFDQGLSSNQGLLDPFAIVDLAAPTGTALQPSDKPLWCVAGKSITIKNSLLAGRSNWQVFGNWYAAYPDITLNVTDSALLNSSGEVALGGNKVTINNSNIIAGWNVLVTGRDIDITSDSARYILAGHLGQNAASAPHSQLNLNADRDLSVKQTTLGAASVALDAQTIILQNVTFKAGSVVSLVSGNGQPSFGNTIQPRYVNFVSNVKYGTNAIQSAADLTVTDTTKPSSTPTAGVYLYKNNR